MPRRGKPLLAMTVEICQAINIGHSEGVSPWESVFFHIEGSEEVIVNRCGVVL